MRFASRKAANLNDIGKIAVPSDTLYKSCKLSAAETNLA